MGNERRAALSAIMDVMERDVYIKAAAETAISVGRYISDPDARQIAYIRRTLRGVCERAIELDHRINAFSKIRIKKMHPIVRNTLRLGCYEICYMDSIPEFSSVNEAVKLLKKNGQGRSAGLCNAVLRRVAESKEMEFYDISIRYSMPEWIAERLAEWYGDERTEDILRAFLMERDLSVRINRSAQDTKEWEERLEETGISYERMGLPIYSGDADEGRTCCYELSGYGSIESIPGYDEGVFYIQDPASASVCEAAGIWPGMRVLDVCAAPGGKALHAADLAGGSGFVEARDVSPEKIRRIDDNIAGSPFTNISTRVYDARKADADSIEKFDAVIVDAPCSGLGVLQKKPEIKYRLKEGSLLELVELQSEILEAASEYPKAGGRLIYSTCTIDPLENEGVSGKFLEGHSEYRIIMEKQILPGRSNDGFYICVMERQSRRTSSP